MKRFFAIIVAILLIGTLCAACTPGSIIDTLNGLGAATPGNARIATSGNAVASPGNAVVSPGNVK